MVEPDVVVEVPSKIKWPYAPVTSPSSVPSASVPFNTILKSVLSKIPLSNK